MAQILIKILEDIVRETKGFPLRISSLGAFPRISSPRVIWVGIDQGDTEVKTLAKTIEEKITKIGIAKEPRPFSSHITLGRTRSGARQEMLVKGLSELGGYFEKNTLEAQVTKITFFKSALTPHGPIYETLKEFPLSPPLIQSAG